MLSKLKSMIKIALLKSLTDGEVYQVGTFEYMGVEQKAVMYSPYGYYSNPPDGTPAILMQIGGSESRQVAFVSDPTQRPTQEKGDAGLRIGDMSVLLHTDGTIEIKGATKEMVAVLYGMIGHCSSAVDAISNLVDAVASAVIPPTGGAPAGLKGIMAAAYVPLKTAVDNQKTNLDNDKSDLNTMQVTP